MPVARRDSCRLAAIATLLALLAPPGAAHAQDGADRSDAVVVTALRNPVDKSYRRMIAGMELFEERRHLAPAARLRFKLLPRNRDTHMEGVELQIVGDNFVDPIDLAPDHTFTLARHAAALEEDASVRPNRRAGTMTWRAEIRTPGLPPDTRRLGDLRLECQVGMKAGLISEKPPTFLGRLLGLFGDDPAYCNRPEP